MQPLAGSTKQMTAQDQTADKSYTDLEDRYKLLY